MDGVSVDKRPSYLQYRAYIEFNENTINNVYAQCYICGQVQDQADVTLPMCVKVQFHVWWLMGGGGGGCCNVLWAKCMYYVEVIMNRVRDEGKWHVVSVSLTLCSYSVRLYMCCLYVRLYLSYGYASNTNSIMCLVIVHVYYIGGTAISHYWHCSVLFGQVGGGGGRITLFTVYPPGLTYIY